MTIKNQWILYELIDFSKVELYFFEIQKKLQWSKRKTKHNLKKLLKSGLIKQKNDKYYATPLIELINWEKMNK